VSTRIDPVTFEIIRHRLNQIIEEAVELIAYQLRVNNVEVRLDLAPDLPILWADPTQLHQVVVNLLTNAQDAMQQMTAPRRVTLTTRSDRTRGRVRLEVADTGPGIPADKLPKIYDPFFTTKPTGQGTGLGLSVALQIVEMHGGKLSIVNRAEGGVRATVLLRLQPEQDTHGDDREETRPAR